MCEYCGVKTPEERKALIEKTRNFADNLERIKELYLRAAHGEEVMHGAISETLQWRIKWVIKELVAEWV